MDPRRFDLLARSLATPKTRRGLAGSVAALVAGALGLRGVDAQVSQVYCGNVICKDNPGKCKPGCVCCIYPNGNSRCRPPGTCSPGQESCPADRPFFEPARGCVQCLEASQCPAPDGVCTSAACVNGACTSAVSEDGAACAGGVCVGGVCCNSGPGFPGSDVCDPLFGGECCTGGTICCGGNGCCGDCFVENEFGTALCCPEDNLCPPRSASNPEPPYCCRPGEICVQDGSSVGANCYIPARVCNGQYCGGECCGGTACCEGGTYCSDGSCLAVPSIECTDDASCGPGLGCTGVVRSGEPDNDVFPGSCCPVDLICDSQLGPDEFNTPDSICCSAGQFCNGPFTCCELEGCSPRGSRTRL